MNFMHNLGPLKKQNNCVDGVIDEQTPFHINQGLSSYKYNVHIIKYYNFQNQNKTY